MQKEKIKIYIDGSNTYHAQKKLGWIIDWKRIKGIIEKEFDVLGWTYYVGVKDGDSSMRDFLKFLGHIGIKISSKPLKKIKIQVTDAQTGFEEEKWIFKANFDVEITADCLLDLKDVDRVVIFSGDSDFNYLNKIIGEHGKKTEFITSKKTIAWEIRKLSGAKIVYLEDIENEVKLKKRD